VRKRDVFAKFDHWMTRGLPRADGYPAGPVPRGRLFLRPATHPAEQGSGIDSGVHTGVAPF
jgi:hypothetical protein